MFVEALGESVTKRIDETVLVAAEIEVPCPALEGVTCASLEGVTCAALEGAPAPRSRVPLVSHSRVSPATHSRMLLPLRREPAPPHQSTPCTRR